MSTAAVWTQDAIFEEAFATIRKGGVRSRYDNFIGGKWVAPSQGKYFADHSPINGVNLAEFARSSAADVETALDAAHAIKDEWGSTSPAARAAVLNRIADRMEENLELLALSRCRSTTSATSQAASAQKRAQQASWTGTPSPTISRNQWAWLGKSFRGIFPC